LRNRRFYIAAVVAVASLGAVVVYAAPPAKVEFNRDVRPVLADTCFKCHGFDKNQRKAELRLDVRDEAIAPHGKSKAIPIVPGVAPPSGSLTANPDA